MKTSSPSSERPTVARDFGILDTLFLMLAVALFAAWILGTLFLYIFPSSGSSVTNAQTIALVGSTDGPAVIESQGSPTGTAAANAVGDSDQANDSGDAMNSEQAQTGNGLAAQEKSVLERKVNTLQKQLNTKSKELTELQKNTKQSAKPNTETTVVTAKYEKEIAQLKREKKQLDREVKKLKDQANAQKAKVQTLETRLADVSKANSMAEATDAKNVEGNLPAQEGAVQKKQPLEFRDWISSKGNKARLAFVRWEDGEIIVVNESNKTFRLTLNRLSPEDQKYVNSKR